MPKTKKGSEIFKKPDCMAKVIVLGNSSVGKTSLLSRYTWDGQSPFNISHTPTIGVDFKSKIIECEGRTMKLQLWDTAGQERYRTLTDNYYNGVSGIMLVYSVTDRKSFDELSEWIYQIHSKANQEIPKIIVANKCDVSSRTSNPTEKRLIELYEGRVLSEKYNSMFLEVSAKQNINVDQAFQMLTIKILQRNQSASLKRQCQIMTLSKKDTNEKEKNSCCT